MPLEEPAAIKTDLVRFAEAKFCQGVKAVFDLIASEKPDEPVLDLIAARWPSVKTHKEH